MQIIGSTATKIHLLALLDGVSQGKTIIITKQGDSVARLVPPEDSPNIFTARETMSAELELGRAHRRTVVTTEELRSRGSDDIRL